MIGIFIFDSSDVLFFQCEDSFKSYFPEEYQIVDKNVILEFFSPIIMLNLSNPNCSLKYFESDGIKIVSEYIDEKTFIIIDNKVDSTEYFLRKYLQLFIKFVCFLFGPFNERLIERNLHYFNEMLQKLDAHLTSEETLVFEAIRNVDISDQFQKNISIFFNKCLQSLSKSNLIISHAYLIDGFSILQSKAGLPNRIRNYDEYFIFLLVQYFLDHCSNITCKDIYIQSSYLVPSIIFFYRIHNDLSFVIITQEYEQISSSLLKLHNESLNFKTKICSNDQWKSFLKLMERTMKSIPSSYNHCCKDRIKAIKQIDMNINSYQFGNHMSNLQKDIREIHLMLFYERNLPSCEIFLEYGIDTIVKKFYIGRCDESFENKNYMNINISEYPGLIYFTFVNRREHKLFAPYVYNKLSSQFTHQSITKQEIFSMVNLIKEDIVKGLSLIIRRTDVYCLVYEIFLLDELGNKMKIKPGEYPALPNLDFHEFFNIVEDTCVKQDDWMLLECWTVHDVQLGNSVILQQRDQLLSQHFPQKQSFLTTFMSFFSQNN